MCQPMTAGTQRGVTLIEVLVALVVIAVGLLGVAAMQTVSLGNAHGSNHHTLATTIAYDALEKARVDLDGRVITGSVPSDILQSIEQGYVARYADRFPGTLSVNLNVSGPDLTVTVAWQDERLGVETSGGSVDTRVNLVQARSRLL
jgi:type IV pilus assembly protein PilV